MGGTHVYRFVAEDAGTYWYHSHQVSHEQVQARPVRRRSSSTARAGREAGARPTWSRPCTPTAAVAPSRAGPATQTVETEARRDQRVRVVNTDNGPLRAWVTGSAVPGPRGRRPRRQRAAPRCATECSSSRPAVGSTSRSPRRRRQPARVDVGGGAALLIGPQEAAAGRAAQPRPSALDLLSLRDAGADIGFDPAHGRPSLRLQRRPTARFHRRPARLLVVDQRPPLPRRTDVRRRRGRRRAHDDQQRQRRRAPHAPARPPRRRPEP